MKKCLDCNKEISIKAIRCRSCSKKGNLNSHYNKHIFCGTMNHHKGEKNSNYKHGNTLKKHYCIDCKIKEIHYQTWYYGEGRCKSCTALHKIQEGKFYGFKKGKDHIGYIDGRGYDKYPAIFNSKLKKIILKRDSYMCQYCNITLDEHFNKYHRRLHVHHIDYNKQNCKEDNLITLCHKCNLRANFNRDKWKEFYTNRLF